MVGGSVVVVVGGESGQPDAFLLDNLVAPTKGGMLLVTQILTMCVALNPGHSPPRLNPVEKPASSTTMMSSISIVTLLG